MSRLLCSKNVYNHIYRYICAHDKDIHVKNIYIVRKIHSLNLFSVCSIILRERTILLSLSIVCKLRIAENKLVAALNGINAFEK